MSLDHHHPHKHLHKNLQLCTNIGRREALRFGAMGIGAFLLAACKSENSVITTTTSMPSSSTIAESNLSLLSGFDVFSDTVKVARSKDLWMIESTGLPAHSMMEGITSWQQQIPLSQPYIGENAWSIPINPIIAATSVSAKTGLFRGAIALAVNGVPIFNALNNRGDDAFLVGELDKWGGHCGRADDYHYHVAPLHLQSIVGKENPIAYALDGFAIYGATEPDGSKMTALDNLNGHVGVEGKYHYHGTTVYPYINGGFKGVVSVVDGQIDPQPMCIPFRPAGDPLNGAVITAFDVTTGGRYSLEYLLGGETFKISYTESGSNVELVFADPTGKTRTETYTRKTS